MSLRKTLGAYVPWPELAAVLDIQLKNQALPARADCPLCGGALHVYEDTIKGGCWHHCFACGSFGDLIELAAAVWDVGLAAAADRLAGHGLPIPPEALSAERLEGYARDHHERARDFGLFWQTCGEYLLRQQRSSTLNALRARFKLQSDVSEARWKAGLGRLLGGIPRATVERLWTPCYQETGGGHATRAVFRGRNWSDVLVVPYHDMPERISGFFFVGRNGDVGDRVHRRVPLAKGQGEDREFGLAGLPLALQAGGDVVAVRDPLTLCRMQCRHLHVSGNPLPLVAWYDGPQGVSSASWRCLGARRIVLWDWAPDCKTWLQAMRRNACVASVGPESDSFRVFDGYLRLHSTADLYQRLLKVAEPWRQALSRLVVKNSDGWAESLFCELRAARVNPLELAGELTAEAHQKVLRVLGDRREERTVALGDRRIAERGAGWWSASGSYAKAVRISNFILRLDRMTDTAGVVRYTGRLLFKGREVPFDFSASALLRNTRDTLQVLAHRYRLGSIYLRDGWGQKLVGIATAFQTPEYVEVEEDSPAD